MLSVTCPHVLHLQNAPTHVSLIHSNCTVCAQLHLAHMLFYIYVLLPFPNVWHDTLLSCHIHSCSAPAVYVSACMYSLMFVFALIVTCAVYLFVLCAIIVYLPVYLFLMYALCHTCLLTFSDV